MQGFSWGSNDLAVTTFLLVSESGGFGVWYIRLNGLQVQTCSVNTSVVSSKLAVFHILIVWFSLSQIKQLESMRGGYRCLSTQQLFKSVNVFCFLPFFSSFLSRTNQGPDRPIYNSVDNIVGWKCQQRNSDKALVVSDEEHYRKSGHANVWVRAAFSSFLCPFIFLP